MHSSRYVISASHKKTLVSALKATRMSSLKLNLCMMLMSFVGSSTTMTLCRELGCILGYSLMPMQLAVQGKSDMQDFSNKQLRGERMDLGRNQQVMAKERERVHLEQRVDMPLSRNVRRQLGDGSKEIEKAVERTGRKGLLASRSQQQVDNQVAKGKRKLDELLAGVLEDRLTLPPIPEEEPAAPEPEPPSRLLPVPLAAPGGLQAPEIIPATVPGDSTVPSPRTSGRSGDAGAGSGSAGGAGRGGAGRAGRGAGRGAGTGAARGRTRGTFIGGRRVPKNARPL
jgi:hypothetical protein